MTEKKPHAYPRYVDADGKLTHEGIRRVQERWKDLFVEDDESIEWGDVELEICRDPDIDWDLWERFGKDVDDESIRSALRAVGAKDDPKADGFVLARERDGLGARTGTGSYVPPIDWLVEGLIPAKSISLIIANPHCMKTWLAMSLLTSAARKDSEWLSRPLSADWSYSNHYQRRKKRVVWVAYEGIDVMPRRFALLGDAGTVYQAAPSLTLSDPRFWTELAKLNPGIVGIDSLSRGNPGIDEKDSRFAEAIGRAEPFAREHGTTFMFIGHSPKDSGSGLVDVVRGTSAVAAAADMVFQLEPVRFTSNDPTEHRARVTTIKHRPIAAAPAPFVFKLTDAGGVQLCDESRPKPVKSALVKLSPDAIVFAAIEANPGTNVASLARDLKMRPAVVASARDLLHAAGRVRIDGQGKNTKLYVAG